MSPQTTVLRAPSRGRRTLAGLTSAALAAGVLALSPTTAHAADPVEAPTLKWKISQQFVDHFSPLNGALSTIVGSDGATVAGDGTTTFGSGIGTHDSGNGLTNVQYDGTVTGSYIRNAGGSPTTYYTIAISDPQIQVDSAGKGKILADVDWTVPGASPESGGTDDVTVVTFDASASDWTSADGLKALTKTPDFTGIVPPNSTTAADLGIPAGFPTNGGAFNSEFLAALPLSLRAHFYLSGSASGDPKKPAASFTATAPKPSVTATVAGSVVTASGSGFTCVTNEGDKGIYLGVAPSGGLPDVSSTGGMSAFAGATPRFCGLGPDTITGAAGVWNTTVNLDVDALDPTKSYSLYTWRAHSHSTTSQDTETPIEIDFGSLKAFSSPRVSAPASRYGAAKTVTVTVPSAATGNVTLTGAGSATAAIKNGVATFRLPATLAPRSYALTATYAGDSGHWKGSATATLSVTKAAAAKAKVKVTKKPTRKKVGKAVVSVAGVPGAAKTTGVVRVHLKKGKSSKVVKAKLKNGKAVVKLPKRAKGTWTIRVAYSGDANYTPRGWVVRGKVKVTK